MPGKAGRAAATGHEAASNAGPHAVWIPEIVEHIGSFLSPNEVVVGLRLVDKQAAAQFRAAPIDLGQSVPPAAFRSLRPASCRRMSMHQRQKLLKLAAASGDVEGLAAAVAAVGCPVPQTTTLLDAAADAGALACCQYIMETLGIGRGEDNTYLLLRAAGKAGLPVVFEGRLRSLVDGGEAAPAPAGGAVPAADGGDLTAWLFAQLRSGAAWRTGAPDWATLALWAAYGCDLPGLQRLQPHLRRLGSRDLNAALDSAIGSPQPDWRGKCAWLMQLGAGLAGAYRAAARLPYDLALERCSWLKSIGRLPICDDPHADDFSCAPGPILRWQLANGLEIPQFRAGVRACKTRHGNAVLVLAQLVQDEDVARSCLLCAAANAAGKGYLAPVRYVAERYGPAATRLPDLVRSAVCSGNPELVSWLLQQPSVPGWSGDDGWAWEEAVAAGCSAVLEVLAETGCPRPTGDMLYDRAACNGDVQTLAVLRRLGVPYGEPAGAMFTQVVAWAPLPALRWLVEEGGCPVDWGAVEEEVQAFSGQVPAEVVDWIGRTRPAGRREG